MKGMRMSKFVMMYVGLLLTFIFQLGGCAYFNQETKETSGSQDEGPATPIYYDFGDVSIPEELKVDNDSSSVYKTPGFAAGVLVLEGRVELYSLITFFENSMPNDKWEFVSSFKSHRTIMIFKKKNRRCVIIITERKLSTLVEIWVAPTINQESSGLAN